MNNSLMTLLASVQAGEATTMMNGILGPVMPNDYKTKLIFLEKLDENVKRRGVLILIASERAAMAKRNYLRNGLFQIATWRRN